MRIRFADFTVDSAARQVLRDKNDVHLSPKAFDFLCLLLARRPNVVTKEELLREIWQETYVTEANINVLASEIRQALSDNSRAPRFIRTVHGVGYAFCGSATDEEREAGAKEDSKSRCWLIGAIRNFPLKEGENIIGRDPSSDVWLDDLDVSRRHARIHIDSATRKLTVEDLGSTNGTWVGRSRIHAATELTDGNVIRIGTIQLKFRDATDEPPHTRRIRRKS